MNFWADHVEKATKRMYTSAEILFQVAKLTGHVLTSPCRA